MALDSALVNEGIGTDNSGQNTLNDAPAGYHKTNGFRVDARVTAGA